MESRGYISIYFFFSACCGEFSWSPGSTYSYISLFQRVVESLVGVQGVHIHIFDTAGVEVNAKSNITIHSNKTRIHVLGER